MSRSKKANPLAALRALKSRSKEVVDKPTQETSIGFVRSAANAAMSGEATPNQWNELLCGLDVCRRVMLASKHDDHAVRVLSELTRQVREARTTGNPERTYNVAILDALDLFESVIQTCPAALLERCEVEAISERSYLQ